MESISSISHEIDEKIAVFKRCFPGLLCELFDGVDLTDALFLRLYYQEIAKDKITVSDNPKNVEDGSIVYDELKYLFSQYLVNIVEDVGTKPVKESGGKGVRKTILAVIGGVSEMDLVEAVGSYVAIRKSYYRRMRVVLKKVKLFPLSLVKTMLLGYGGWTHVSKMEPHSMPKKVFDEMNDVWLKSVDRLQELSGHEQEQVHNILRQMPVLARLCWRVQLLLGYDPAIIIGAFEKSPLGTLVYDCVKAGGYNCKVINVQHGHNWGSPALSRVKFDRFFAWDDLTRHNLEVSGYHPLENVRIVGNPLWNRLQKVAGLRARSVRRSLECWKAGSPTLLVCSQPHSEMIRRNFRDVVLSYLEAHDDVKLFVRPHPTESNELTEEWLKSSSDDVNKRIRVLPVADYDLKVAMACSDLVCCIDSAVLHDALYAGKPVLSIDVTDRNTGCVGSHFYKSVPVCKTQDEAFIYIDRILSGEIKTEFLLPPDFDKLFPSALNELADLERDKGG